MLRELRSITACSWKSKHNWHCDRRNWRPARIPNRSTAADLNISGTHIASRFIGRGENPELALERQGGGLGKAYITQIRAPSFHYPRPRGNLHGHAQR